MTPSQLIKLVRAARVARAHPAKVFIWVDDEAEIPAKIAAAQATRRLGPSTEVCVVRWLPDGSETAPPANP